jgi:flagellar basal-body rod protein FlgC
MGMFGAIDTAGSGATVARTWLDAISDNIANINTTRPAGEEPFRARLVVAQSVEGTGGVGQGVRVGGIALKSDQPVRTFDPGNPHADADGYVTRPVVEISEEMTNLLVAQRSYQLNLAVMDRARDAYLSALQIGQGR